MDRNKQLIALQIAIAINAVLFVCGIVAPMLTLEKFVLFSNTFSIITGITTLLEEGKIFLFIIITLFSLVLPTAKLIVIFLVLRQKTKAQLQRYLQLMHTYGKWSMLDVFVVGIMVVIIKIEGMIKVELHYGFYIFTSAVLMTMVLTTLVSWLDKK
mgnify:FL=1